MDQFGKILQKIYDSTLMAEHGMFGVYVMESMIILSDKRGVLNIAPKIFANRIGMEWEQLKEILSYLEKSDPESNIKEYKGRRIIPLDQCDQFEENRGYFIVNKRFYAGKDNPKTSKERTAKHRKKESFLKLLSELGVCNVTETLPDEIVTILSISISTSISISSFKYLIESGINLTAWFEYESYRKEIKSPLKTEYGRTKLINFLKKYPQDIQQKIVTQTKDEEWKGLFELKNKNNKKTNQSTEVWDEIVRTAS